MMARSILIIMTLMLFNLNWVLGTETGPVQKQQGSSASERAQIVDDSYEDYYGNPYSPPPYYSYPPYYWVPPPQDRYFPPHDPFQDQLIPAGRVILLVDPVTAVVAVDGLRLTQHSDLSYQIGLLMGEHKVEVKAAGYEPYEKVVDIKGGQRLLLTVRLQSSKK